MKNFTREDIGRILSCFVAFSILFYVVKTSMYLWTVFNENQAAILLHVLLLLSIIVALPIFVSSLKLSFDIRLVKSSGNKINQFICAFITFGISCAYMLAFNYIIDIYPNVVLDISLISGYLLFVFIVTTIFKKFGLET